MIFPEKFICGETIKVEKLSVSDYSAVDWDLTVIVRGSGESAYLEYEAGKDGDYFTINIDTSDLPAGFYGYQAKVSNESENYYIETGSFNVLTAYDVNNPHDTRTHAHKMLDAIEALLEGRATNEQKRIKINNREIEHHTLKELTDLRDYYKAEIARKSVKRNKSFRNVGIRF